MADTPLRGSEAGAAGRLVSARAGGDRSCPPEASSRLARGDVRPSKSRSGLLSGRQADPAAVATPDRSRPSPGNADSGRRRTGGPDIEATGLGRVTLRSCSSRRPRIARQTSRDDASMSAGDRRDQPSERPTGREPRIGQCFGEVSKCGVTGLDVLGHDAATKNPNERRSGSSDSVIAPEVVNSRGTDFYLSGRGGRRDTVSPRSTYATNRQGGAGFGRKIG